MKGVKTLRYVEPFTTDPKDKKDEILFELWQCSNAHSIFLFEGSIIIQRYCDTCIKTIVEPSNAGRLDEK